jgi:hypothetical protein
VNTRLLALLLLYAAVFPAQAEDLGKLWPACKGWDSPDGLDQTYTTRDLSANEARQALDRLAATEGKPSEGDGIDSEIDSINRVQGYALRRSAESPTWDAPHHRSEVKRFCRWLVTHYMPE